MKILPAVRPPKTPLGPDKALKSHARQAPKGPRAAFGSLLRGSRAAKGNEVASTLGREAEEHGGLLTGPSAKDGDHRDALPRKRADLGAPGLDSTARHAAQLGPPVLAPPAPLVEQSTEVVASRVRASLEDLVPALVRRVGWSGDGRRGTVRLELGAGELAGATLLVHADEGRVRVQLSAPGAVDLAGWRDRLAERLAARGLQVDELEVK
jgi:hypothetical protein